MRASIHIPKPLLDAVDRKARTLRLSRNRLIIKALEREVEEELGWSPGFFDRLTPVDEATAAAVEDMLAAIQAARPRSA